MLIIKPKQHIHMPLEMTWGKNPNKPNLQEKEDNLLVGWLNLNFMVASLQIQIREHRATRQAVQLFVYTGCGVEVHTCIGIQGPVIYT